jgi:hypothetical protein
VLIFWEKESEDAHRGREEAWAHHHAYGLVRDNEELSPAPARNPSTKSRICRRDRTSRVWSASRASLWPSSSRSITNSSSSSVSS